MRDVARAAVLQILVLLFWTGITLLEIYVVDLSVALVLTINFIGCLYNSITVWAYLIKW